jgi:hypothetical protein
LNYNDLTRAEFAKLIGVNRTRVQQLISAGSLGPEAHAKLDIELALPAYIAHLKERASAGKNSDERIKKARAEKLELANEATKRDLIPAEEVRREVTRAFQELKGQLLIIPRRLGQPLALETDPVSVEEKIHKELVSVLEARSVAELTEVKK